MISTITCYNNTGFDLVNRPSSPAVLTGASSTTFDSVWVFQELDRASVKIKATYDQVKAIDYVKIGSVYYFVSAITMENEQTCNLSLAMDPLLTAGGINSLTVTGGWEERACVSDDALFSNILPESFEPTNRLDRTQPSRVVLENGNYGSYLDAKALVAATIDLANIEYIADSYYDAATQSETLVDVPRIPKVKRETMFSVDYMYVPEVGEVNEPTDWSYPATSLFNMGDPDIMTAIAVCRSLGIDGAITRAYLLPKYGVFNSLMNVDGKTYTQFKAFAAKAPLTGEKMGYRYSTTYTPKNNKAYALFNTYEVFSGTSGDSMSYDAHDIYNNDETPTFVLAFDPSPSGKPYLSPLMYLGAPTAPFQNAVVGSNWLNSPLSFSDASGWLKGQGAMYRSAFDIGTKNMSSILNAIPNAIAEIGKGVGNILGVASNGATEVMSSLRQQKELSMNYQDTYEVVAPEVKFPQDDMIQGYVGNCFYAVHTHLTDADLERFDNYLTQFGYAVDRKFVKADLSTRQYFNYIKTNGAVVKAANQPLRVSQLISAMFDSGVRLWHVLPNTAAMVNNPIRG